MFSKGCFFVLFILLIFLSGKITGQGITSNLAGNATGCLFESEKESRYFLGFHSYTFPLAMEYLPVKEDLFEQIITDGDIPFVKLSPGQYLSGFSLMRNRLFSGLGFSYFYANEAENDSLISKLHQSSLSVRLGYNILIREKVALSPYVGFRYARFRHQTGLNAENVSLDDYLSVRELDFRVLQYFAELGINSSFIIEGWSLNLYASYLQSFTNTPVLKSGQQRINHRMSNPVGHFVIGLGFGLGSNSY